MSSKGTARFKRRLFLRILLGVALSMLLLLFLLFLADGILNNLLADVMSTVNHSMYIFLRSHKTEVILAAFVVVAIFSIWIAVSAATRISGIS